MRRSSRSRLSPTSSSVASLSLSLLLLFFFAESRVRKIPFFPAPAVFLGARLFPPPPHTSQSPDGTKALESVIGGACPRPCTHIPPGHDGGFEISRWVHHHHPETCQSPPLHPSFSSLQSAHFFFFQWLCQLGLGAVRKTNTPSTPRSLIPPFHHPFLSPRFMHSSPPTRLLMQGPFFFRGSGKRRGGAARDLLAQAASWCRHALAR